MTCRGNDPFKPWSGITVSVETTFQIRSQIHVCCYLHVIASCI